MEKCWHNMALDDRCPNAGTWKSSPRLIEVVGVGKSFIEAVRWCGEHRFPDDIPDGWAAGQAGGVK